MLIWGVAAGQEPSRPSPVVVIPSAIRDSMSAIWTANNRHWDWVPEGNVPLELQGAPAPTRRYLGCLTGSAAGDTLWSIAHSARSLCASIGATLIPMNVASGCWNVVRDAVTKSPIRVPRQITTSAS